MSKFLLTVLREAFSKQRFERIPEPCAIMSAVENVNDFDAEGNPDGAMAASYLFVTSQVSKTFSGCKHVLDLGCGSGQLLCQVAEINPEINFTGVDLSEEMLDKAKKRAQSMNLYNVQFVKQDFTKLQEFVDKQFDGVMCVNALHHLNDLQSLRNFFKAVNSIIKQDTSTFIYDFCRMHSEKSIDFFVEFVGIKQALCREDFRNSLKAAFSLDEFKLIIDQELHQKVNIYTTRLMNIYLMIKTEERSISEEKIGKLDEKLTSLSLKNQMAYKNISKRFFKID